MDLSDHTQLSPSIDDRTSAPSDTASASAATTIESEVSNLVTGFSSWWSGVAHKSQAQLSQAKQHVDSQGGLLSFAKKEYIRLEAQLSDAQRQARESSQNAAAFPLVVDELDVASSSVQDPSTFEGKGKQRAVDPDADATPLAASKQEPSGSALEAASSFLNRITTQLTSDPRVVALQNNLRSSLRGDGDKTLSNLSRTIQAHLPHLDLSQSQALAARYLEASENFAKDLGKDMKVLAGELVEVVPPQEAEKEAEKGKEKSVEEQVEEAVRTATMGKQVQVQVQEEDKEEAASKQSDHGEESSKVEEDDDFVWDEEDQAAGDEANGETRSSSVPVTPTPVDVDAAAKDATATTTTATAKTQAKEEDSEDSDWE